MECVLSTGGHGEADVWRHPPVTYQSPLPVPLLLPSPPLLPRIAPSTSPGSCSAPASAPLPSLSRRSRVRTPEARLVSCSDLLAVLPLLLLHIPLFPSSSSSFQSSLEPLSSSLRPTAPPPFRYPLELIFVGVLGFCAEVFHGGRLHHTETGSGSHVGLNRYVK